MDDLRIVCVQSDIIWQDRDANLQHLDNLLHHVGNHADLVVLPETFNTAFPVAAPTCAETTNGITMNWMRNLAKRENVVICGTMVMKSNDGYHNTLVWMHPDGTYSYYHKRHTFTIGGEGEPIKKGTERLVVNLKGWKIMPLVCYDIRFPKWSRNSLIDREFLYDVLIYTANFPDTRIDVWDTLLAARAIENQSFVVAVNRVGTTPDGTSYNGHTQLIDAKGKRLAIAEEGAETLLKMTLHADELLNFRKKFPVSADWDTD